MFYTEEDVKKEIVDEQYVRVPGTTVTVCALTVRNGFTFIGYSGAADPIKFDEIIGKTCAYEKAFKKALECYAFLGKEIECSSESNKLATDDPA